MAFRPLCALALLACVTCGSGCRAVQIHRLEDRVDKLEARAAALEAKVEMLSKK